MLRAAQLGDEPAIEAFLAAHADTSMFLRANLADFGLAGSDDPRATTYWLSKRDGGIRAVFGRSNAGFLLLQAPDKDPEDLADFCRVLNGQSVAGITGEAGQVAALLPYLELPEGVLTLDRSEPLFHLSLNTLKTPDLPGTLRAPEKWDRAMLEDWFWDYEINALGAPESDATRAQVARRVEHILTARPTRILEVNGTPVATTSFNATLPDMVQIGGVYTPPDLRSRGYARRAVALHLAEARSEGIKTAILFASGEPACRAYEAIGFQRIGSYHLALLKEPITLEATA